MKKGIKINVSIIVLALMAFTLAGCSQTAASSLIGIKTAEVKEQKLEKVLDLAGVLVPEKTVNVVSKISGQVTDMTADVGSTVKTGDTLITLETKLLNAQLQQADAAYRSAEAAEQSVADQAGQAKINLDTAQKAYDRIKSLFDTGAASSSQLEDAASKLELAKKQYEIASGSALKQAQAAIGTAQANINSIKVQLENAVITSPISGVVTNRNINTGELAAPGAPLITIADTSKLKLKSTISQDVIPNIVEGQEIDVIVDVYPNKVFKGKVSSIGPMSVGTGEYFPVEISIDNTDGIKAGLSAHASIKLSGSETAVVPASAVVRNNGQSYVFKIENNIAKKCVVITGMSNEKDIEILKGLEAGDKIATSNVNSLVDGMQVNVN